MSVEEGKRTTPARPPVGTKVTLIHDGQVGTIVPTGRGVPADEVNVMLDVTGSVATQPLSNLTTWRLVGFIEPEVEE